MTSPIPSLNRYRAMLNGSPIPGAPSIDESAVWRCVGSGASVAGRRPAPFVTPGRRGLTRRPRDGSIFLVPSAASRPLGTSHRFPFPLFVQPFRRAVSVFDLCAANLRGAILSMPFREASVSYRGFFRGRREARIRAAELSASSKISSTLRHYAEWYIDSRNMMIFEVSILMGSSRRTPTRALRGGADRLPHVRRGSGEADGRRSTVPQSTASGGPITPVLPAAPVDLDQAVAVRTALVSRAARRLDPEVWAAERQLARWAGQYGPAVSTSMGRQLIDGLDRDGAEPDRELDNHSNELHLTKPPTGSATGSQAGWTRPPSMHWCR